MKRIVECVPNFSEGKDESIIKKIVDEIQSVEGIQIWNVTSNPDHNRTVVTFVGNPEAVKDAAIKSAIKADELIDMRKHKGEHTRIGAADVIPFIPLKGVSLEECIDLANDVGSILADKLNAPVYMYAEAAKIPELKDIAYVQNVEYEGLINKKDTEYIPDYGVNKLNPKTGGVIVGARNILVAFNVNLGTSNLEIAKKIASCVSESGNGLKNVRAIPVKLEDENLVQIALNIIDYKKTPLYKPYEMIRNEASRWGVPIVGSGFVGLMPTDALVESSLFYFRTHGFTNNQLIETKLYNQ